MRISISRMVHPFDKTCVTRRYAPADMASWPAVVGRWLDALPITLARHRAFLGGTDVCVCVCAPPDGDCVCLRVRARGRARLMRLARSKVAEFARRRDALLWAGGTGKDTWTVVVRFEFAEELQKFLRSRRAPA